MALLRVEILRAAWWAAVTLRRTRRDLAQHGLRGTRPAPPPDLPAEARRGVSLALRALRGTCLERALLLQSWEAAHGHMTDVVIGVAGPSQPFRAHAWLESTPDATSSAFTVIHRIPAAPA